MTATIDRYTRDAIIKRYNDARIELNDGVESTVDVNNLSTEFMQARLDFAAWYDSKSEDIQYLIDEISDRTSFIIDESDYDQFIDILSDYGITTAEQFESAFEAEYEGYGEHIYAKFAEEFCDSACLTEGVPDLFINAIDYEQVYYQSLQYDFMDFDFNENRYFFRNNF